jgi:hypothetical protein
LRQLFKSVFKNTKPVGKFRASTWLSMKFLKEIMKAQNKKFDCVEMKHQIQSVIYKKTKRMSPEEEIKYFNEKAQE